MMQPTLSVIMPVYNAEKRLIISVDSILHQSYHKIELILINDGSIDSSRKICDYYLENDSRVKVIHQQNSGVSVARNTGIKQASGDYITFVDSDDTIDPETYVTVMSHLRKTSIDMIIYGMSFDYFKSGSYSHSRELTVTENIDINKRNIKSHFFYLYEKNYLTSTCNKIIKASAIQDNMILFETDMAILEDFHFVLNVLQNTEEIKVLKNPFYHYYNDLTISKLSKRPSIDYLNNFRLLDKKLNEFVITMGFKSQRESGRINAMILRYYLIAIERLFASNNSWNEKHQELRRYVMDVEIGEAVNLALISGKRLKMTQLLMKKKYIKRLYMAFWLNDKYKRIVQKYS